MAPSKSVVIMATGSGPSSDSRRNTSLSPVKVNAVLVRGVNDDEVVDFATFGRERGVSVRFIEFMPLDATGEWTAEITMTNSVKLKSPREDAGIQLVREFRVRTL